MVGIAAVAVYGYLEGWFSSLIPVASATPVPTGTGTAQNPTGTSNPINAGTQIVNAPTPSYTPPAVYSYNPAGAAAASLPATAAPYIVATAGQVVPAGYSTVNTVDSGTVFLRDDLYAKAFAANIQVASPLANITLAGMKSAAGVSGLGMAPNGLGYTSSWSGYSM